MWHLNLDQVESGTGRILERVMGPAAQAGNSTYAFDNRNVLYSKLRPYLNKVVCPEQPGIATTELVPLRPATGVLDRRFLAYFLRSRPFVQFASQTIAGAKMPRVIMDKLWEYRIPVPPLSEQRRIVEILDQADALQKKRAEADAKAARILPALFYKMFGDPASNPHGWREVALREIGRVRGGKRLPKGDAYSPHPTIHRYARGVDIRPNWIERGQMVYLYPETQQKIRKYTISTGDVVITIAGKIGVAAPVEDDLDGVNLTENAAKIVATSPRRFAPEYLSALLNTAACQEQIRLLAGRVTIGKLALFRLEGLRIMLPPLELQLRFARFLESVRTLEASLGRNQDSGSALLRTLLHRAFSGELTAAWRGNRKGLLDGEMAEQERLLEE
ncbi:MAG: restriction endonuclease subunit S, partial [Candidatus Eisenbacteria bacterium]